MAGLSMRISSLFCLLFICLNTAAMEIINSVEQDLIGREVNYFTKETIFGSIEYREGDVVFDPNKEVIGIIKRIYHKGYVCVGYILEDNTTKYHIEEINNIHKKLAEIKIEENGRIFYVGEKVVVGKAKKLAIIKYFYDNGLINLRYLGTSGDEQCVNVYINWLNTPKTIKRKDTFGSRFNLTSPWRPAIQ